MAFDIHCAFKESVQKISSSIFKKYPKVVCASYTLFCFILVTIIVEHLLKKLAIASQYSFVMEIHLHCKKSQLNKNNFSQSISEI